MLTGTIKAQVDAVWNAFSAGGIVNHLLKRPQTA
jgi:hypothetical protein